MRTSTRITAVAMTLALALAPAAALAHGGPTSTHGASQSAPGHTATGSQGTPPGNAKAYGRYCRTEVKTHVAGQPGTPFSACVKDMARLARSARTNPHIACANEIKKHVAGQQGTPYSECVSAAAKLRGHGTSSSTG